ncbi:MAG: 6-phosphofructokinase [Bacteroidales bacterium]
MQGDNSTCYQVLTDDIVNKAGRTGGTFLHTSRAAKTHSHVAKADVPEHLRTSYSEEMNDMTPELLRTLSGLGLLSYPDRETIHSSYGVHLFEEVNVVAIPKTMDNDVPGTDYCIGFSTCVTRTIQMTNSLRTTAGSHERLMILEVLAATQALPPCFPQWPEQPTIGCVIPWNTSLTLNTWHSAG